MNTKRLTKKQMIIFAIGQLGWSTLSGIISAWLVTFYLPTSTDLTKGATVYLYPFLLGGFITVLGLISALGRVFDAVTDPLIASLSDNSKNPRGRRTPFMQVAALPLAVVTVLLFSPLWGRYDSANGALNIVWVSVMLVLFYLFMTMYCTPYNSLISEYGKTQEDRMFISTAISLTFFVGTLLAYTPFVMGDVLRGVFGGVDDVSGLTGDALVAAQNAYAWSYRAMFIFLAVLALVCMLLPTFLIKETDYVEGKASGVNVFKSLGSTFKNRDFKVFAGSDVMYWVGLTMFQTALPYFVKVSMHLPDLFAMVFLGAMTVLSAAFYPFVTKLVMKFGKKKLVIFAFFGLAVAYVLAALSNLPIVDRDGPQAVTGLGVLFGVGIVVLAAFPMALLGIIPQSIVADVAEADGVTTGEKREGMFFAARTFAMKFGQSLALVLFTSLSVIGQEGDTSKMTELVPTTTGLLIAALVAIGFCVTGALILFLYREKHVMKIIAKEGDEKFMRAVEANSKEKD